MAVTFQRDAGIARLRLNRPERRNALDRTILDGLRGPLRELRDDAGTSVVVLEAEGPVFSAGLDRDEPAVAGTYQEQRVAAGQWQHLLDDLEALPQVTIAAVRGAAIGGGLILAATCDLRIAAEGTMFRLPELSLGLPLAWGAAARLVRAVGLSHARDLVLTSRTMTAAEAQRCGLVQRVVSDDDLDDAVLQLARSLSAVPLGPLSQAKQALRHADLPGSSWADADRALALLSSPASPAAPQAPPSPE